MAGGCVCMYCMVVRGAWGPVCKRRYIWAMDQGEETIYRKEANLCWEGEMEDMRLLTFMAALESIGELLGALTKRPTQLQLVSSADREHRFEMLRNGRGVRIKVRVSEDWVESCWVKRLYSEAWNQYRRVEDLGDLKNCICAHLVPCMRVVNVLKAMMQEQLTLGPSGKSVEIKGGSQRPIRIRLDEDHERILVKGGVLDEQSFEVDDVETEGLDHERFYFFENPFWEQRAGSTPTLLPKTMDLVSYILGSFGLQNLKLWERCSSGAAEGVERKAPSSFAASRAVGGG